ncbi:reverse transcriptase domain-containing protein [Tanacetum coccineum]
MHYGSESRIQANKKANSRITHTNAPMENEEIIVYLTVAREPVSAVLMTEREAKQMPIYFFSRALQGLEINYTPMEKLVLALVHASKRLKRLRISVKGKILADFIVERPEDDSLTAPMEVEEELPDPWTLFTYGSSCIDGSGAGLILTSPDRTKLTYALRFEFDATNNEAEYEALIAGLRIAEQMGIKKLQTHVDSRLVANQVNGYYIAKEPVPKSKNKKADALSKIASTSFAHLTKQVMVEVLKEKSINEAEVLTVVEEERNTWMTPIYEYLTEETLPAKRKKARVVRLKSRRYAVINGVLYKKSFLKPWLRCVGPLQASYVMREIHEGSCSIHAGPRSVVAKAIRTGYYWPTMHKDARKVIRECQDCQVHHLVPRNPQQKFGLPGEIISDNGKQFRDNPFKDWCEKLNIHQHFASVKHPQTNDLVERANRSLGEGIKARLDKRSKD